MTDNEIIKALDILDKFEFFQGQRAWRELWNEKPTEVQDNDIQNFSKDVSFLKDLINRQKAEISVKRKLLKKTETLIQKERAKAIKEFAERLKECAYDLRHYDGECVPIVEAHCIDRIVKEMTEEKK